MTKNMGNAIADHLKIVIAWLSLVQYFIHGVVIMGLIC